MADKLNVIILNDFAHVNGGAAQVAISSAEGLASHGHRILFFSAVLPIADSLQRDGVTPVVTRQYEIKKDTSRIRAIVQGIWNRKAAQEFAAVLRRFDPRNTIVHVHGWSKALSSSPIREAIRSGFVVVCTLHDYFYSCPNGGFYNFQTQRVCTLNPLSMNCILEHCDRDGYGEKLWRCTRQFVQNRSGFAGVRNFIVLSGFSREKISEYLPTNARVFHIPNPIDVETQSAVTVASNSAFLAVGRISPEKGYDLFVRAASDLGVSAKIVGDGPDRQRVQRLSSGIEITGWQTQFQVKAILRSARALVFPSVWYEAQPLVVLEAAAMGVPAIVADSCAARDSVVDGETGLWFQGGSVEDLKRKMQLLKDPDYVERLGANAYRRYWDVPCDLERHVRALESCYYRLLTEYSNQ